MNALIDLELGVADRLDHCLLIALRRGASHTMACDHFNVFQLVIDLLWVTKWQQDFVVGYNSWAAHNLPAESSDGTVTFL